MKWSSLSEPGDEAKLIKQVSITNQPSWFGKKCPRDNKSLSPVDFNILVGMTKLSFETQNPQNPQNFRHSNGKLSHSSLRFFLFARSRRTEQTSKSLLQKNFEFLQVSRPRAKLKL